jgi:parvulin-like peptidyl-prolyl isomerase
MAIVVNGEKIEDSQIKQEAEDLRPKYENAFDDMNPQEREAQLLEWSRENLIERTLFRQEIISSGLTLPKEKVDTIFVQLKNECKDQQEFYKKYSAENDEQIKEQINAVAKMQLKFAQIFKDITTPSKEDIRKYYEENKEHFKNPEQVKTGIILRPVNLRVEEETAYGQIKQIYDQFLNGVVFEFLIAKENAKIDFVARGRLPQEIDDVIFNLGVGQVSNIFRSRYGYHIAKVYEKRPPTQADLNQVKDQIAEILIKQEQDKAFFAFIDQLRAKARIEEVKP